MKPRIPEKYTKALYLGSLMNPVNKGQSSRSGTLYAIKALSDRSVTM